MNHDPVGIAGLGFLGRGIAACLLARGYRVIGYTPDRAALPGVRRYIQDAVDELSAAGSPVAPSWEQRYIEAGTLAEFAPCRFVIESVVEDLGVKQDVFNQIEEVIAPDVPVASNTSALPISLLQASRTHPERFLGMHWAEPAYATRFMELIRGDRTSDDAFEQAASLARQLDKDPAMVQKDIPGFIVNRLGYAMYREAIHLLEAGVADVESIDRAFKNALGLWATFCGPFRWIDITGGPTLYANAMRGVFPTLSNATELPDTLETMRRNNDRGVLNGRGFYQYGPEDAARWEALLHEHAWAVKRLQDKYSSPSND